MKKAIYSLLAITICLLSSYLVFFKPENTIAVKTQQNIKILVYFSKSLINGNTFSTQTKNLPSESIRNLLEQYSIKELKSVFSNRYDEKGYLKYHNKFYDGDSLTGWQSFCMKDSSSAIKLITLLNMENGVYSAHIEQPLLLKPCIAPNDPSYSYQWHLNCSYNPMADIRAEQAWNINRGRNDVIIAVCDGGVDYTHKDLDPGDRSHVIAGYDFGSNDNNPMDDLPDNATLSYAGHGTHVAGIIGAIANNGKQVAGVMWNCKIMPVKMVGGSTIRGPFGGTIHDFSTTALPTDVANAIDYAVNHGAQVINLSYGFSAIGFPVDEVILKIPLLYSTIANAYNSNVVVVAAMGNEHEKGNPTNYPAGFAHEVIAVGNTTSNFQRATSSSTGNHIDVSAPGSGILSTIRGGGIDTKSGTSMAAPVVSGVAGLIISQGLDRGFNLTNDDVLHILEKTADDMTQYGAGWDAETGYGKVNAYRALSLINAPNELYHWVSYGGTASKTNLSKWIYTGGSGRWGLASGMYLDVDQYTITKHIQFDVPFCSIPAVWLRERESVSMSSANPNDGFPYAEITNITETGFDVKFFTYFVRYNSAAQAINKWIPTTTSATKIAYTAVGIPVPTISGPSFVCTSGATFIVNNLPGGEITNWNSSSNLSQSSTSSNSATFIPNGYGIGWVEATVNTACGTTSTQRINVMVGSPTPTITAKTHLVDGEPITYLFTATPYSNATYSWYVNNTLQDELGNTFDLYVPCGHTSTVKCSLTNTCGTSAFSNSSTKAGSCTKGSTYSVSPNPTNSELTIRESREQSSSKEQVESNPIYLVQIYDRFGMLVFQKSYPQSTSEVRESIANLPKGIYVVKINQGEQQESATIIKE